MDKPKTALSLPQQQLELFAELASVAGIDSSATIELLDAAPKYIQQPASADVTKPWVQEIKVRGVPWKMTMTPVSLSTKGDTALKARFPGPREEIIEQVLRKMATDTPEAIRGPGEGEPLPMLVVTLSQIRRRCEKEGHGFKISEIDEALTIMDGVRFDMEGPTKIKASGIIRRTQIGAPGDLSGERTAVAITFHPLFYRSLSERSYRLLKYDRFMSLKRPLARWLYQRLTHNFIQAQRGGALSAPYHIALSTILENSTMKRYSQLRGNVRQVRLALDEMREVGILDLMRAYEEKPVFDKRPGPGRAVMVDVIFYLRLSDDVASEIADANRKLKERRGELR